MLPYHNPQSKLPLRAALAELRAAEGDITMEVDATLAAALESHDVVHVLFGLDTSELDEVVAHGWMLLGTTMTMREMHAVMAQADHRRLATDLGHVRRLGLLVRAAPRLFGAFWRARRMSKRWPFADYSRYLDVPLDQIRREYGIALSPKQAVLSGQRGPHHGPVVVRG
jgi:hypothetical protein